MKAIKVIGLAALTALMAMALVGASSAMAESTSLCSADESPCAEGNQLGEVHETSVGKAKLLTSIGTTECNVLFSGTTSTKLATPLVISGKFTYTSCKLGETECTATEENGPAEILVLKEGHEKAKVTGEGLVHLVCGGLINCSYNGTGLVGVATGPLLSTQANGEVVIREQKTTKEAGGSLCPKEAKLDITTTPLTSLLCKADESPCSAGNLITSVHETSVGKAKLLTSFGTTECNVLFSSTSVGALGPPQRLEGNFTYTNCELLGGSCTATEENGPAEILVFKEGHEKAKVTGEGLVHLVCGSSIDCSYTSAGLVGAFTGPLLSTQANGEVVITGQKTTKEAGGFLCPKEAKLDITTTPLTATYIVDGTKTYISS